MDRVHFLINRGALQILVPRPSLRTVTGSDPSIRTPLGFPGGFSVPPMLCPSPLAQECRVEMVPSGDGSPCTERNPVCLAVCLSSAVRWLWSRMEEVESSLAPALGLCQVEDRVDVDGED